MPGTIDKTFYEIGKWMLAAAIAAAIFVWKFGDSWLVRVPDCYFETITGLYCPGCGGTRAAIALLQGHPVKSFICHPVVPYAAAVYTVFMIRTFMLKHCEDFSRKYILEKPYHDGGVLIFIYTGIALAIIQWIIKLVLLIGYDIHVI
jgi:hypothetical protein